MEPSCPRGVLLRRIGAAMLLLATLAAGWIACLYSQIPRALGPLVQRVHATGFSVVWWDRAADQGQMTVVLPGESSRTVMARCVDGRWTASVDGLEPSSEITYRVKSWSAAEGLTFDHEERVRTARQPGEPVRFAVLGDSGNGDAETRELARTILRFRPDFVLHAGDVVYRHGAWAGYPQRFFEPFRELAAAVPIYPVAGNHDLEPGGGRAFLRVFDLPDNGPDGPARHLGYWFDCGDARIVALDSNEDAAEMVRNQEPWLARALAGAPSWKFAVMHHPAYSVGSHGSSEVMQHTLAAACEAGGVQVVFAGHNHTYVRTQPMRGGVPRPEGGTVYITSGQGAVERNEPAGALPSFVAAFNDHAVSSTLVEAEGDRLRIRQVDSRGRAIDDASWVRGPGGLRSED